MENRGDELRLAVMRLARRMRQERANGDVTDSQLSVLFIVSKEGPHTISDLSEIERVTPPSINRTVNQLAEFGLVVRSSSPDDGRVVLVTATETGRTLVQETRRRRAAWLASRVAELTPEQQELLHASAPILAELADS